MLLRSLPTFISHIGGFLNLTWLQVVILKCLVQVHGTVYTVSESQGIEMFNLHLLSQPRTSHMTSTLLIFEGTHLSSDTIVMLR